MLLTEEQLRMLRSAVVYDPSKVPTDLPDFNVRDDTSIEKLKSKMKNRFNKIQHELRFDEYNFIEECDIGLLTGRQILQLFMRILNDPTKYKAGNCLMFSMERKAEVAFAINDTRSFEVRTVTRDDKRDKRMYQKIFDEQYKFKPNKPWSSTPRTRANIRKRVPEQIKLFLNNEVKNCESGYRCAFLGMLQELARVEKRIEEGLYKVLFSQLQQVPVAACVKLAVEVEPSQTGNLQQVFGSHGIHDDIEDKIKQEYAAEHGVEISSDELYKRTLQEKKRMRFKAAEEIIQSSFVEQNEDGSYNDDVIEREANEVREFFM
ncbi:uncharacterized protein LOC104266132 [Ciona intestinalis]